MRSNWINRSWLVVILIMAGGLVANAGTVQLGNSGWMASWDDAHDNYLDLNVDYDGSECLIIEKFAHFTAADVDREKLIVNPLVITFQQVSSNATPVLVITDEQVVNNTGFAWTGFTFELLGGSNVFFDAGRTDIKPPGNGFSIDPFTQYVYSNDFTRLDVSGGVVPSGPPVPGSGDSNVWFPGAASGGLAIISSPLEYPELRSFTLKEIPQIIIPVPAAALTGFLGAAAVALFSSRKSLQRFFV